MRIFGQISGIRYLTKLLTGYRTKSVCYPTSGHNPIYLQVDGFEAKGSYKEDIQYHAPMEMIEALVNRSDTCVQGCTKDIEIC